MLERSQVVRVFSRPHGEFFFEADAELIIHGAAEAGSTIKVAGQPIKVKPDGTFHLRIPFSQSLLNYVMEAVAPNGEQAKTISLNFSQEVPKEG
jgi:phosphate transport system substrate-binding protein